MYFSYSLASNNFTTGTESNSSALMLGSCLHKTPSSRDGNEVSSADPLWQWPSSLKHLCHLKMPHSLTGMWTCCICRGWDEKVSWQKTSFLSQLHIPFTVHLLLTWCPLCSQHLTGHFRTHCVSPRLETREGTRPKAGGKHIHTSNTGDEVFSRFTLPSAKPPCAFILR